MTARDYPCPDCERDECGGLGCIGRVRMETWPFAKKGVCRVPSTDKPKRKRSKGTPKLVTKPCDVCRKPFVGPSYSKRCSLACRSIASKRYDDDRYARKVGR